MGRIFTYFFLVALFFSFHNTLGQINITSVPQEEVNMDVENGDFQVEIENRTGSTVSGVVITISLPSGVKYIPGSLSEDSNFQISELNVSNLSTPTFQASNLPNESSYLFGIQYSADCDAINFQLEGGVFRNGVSVSSSAGSFNHTSDAYNILYPALTITSVSPKNQNINNQDTTVRSITIVNGGYGGLQEFYVGDQHPQGLEILSVNKGSFSNGVIHLTGADFTAIGNGDKVFDKDESIVIEETLYSETCVDVTHTSTIEAYWQLDGSTCQGSSTYSNVAVNYITPVIQQNATPSFSTCYSSEPSAQVLELKNTTAAIAQNIEVDIFNSSGDGFNPDIYSKIDVGSITYKVGSGGTLKSITPTASYNTSSAGFYSCLGANAVGKVTLALPDLSANESIFIYWNTEHCCINSCIDAELGGWESTVRYTDNCEESYTNSIVGQEPVTANMSFFTETPAFISDGEKKNFTFLVSSHENTYPTAQDAYYEVHFQLPSGLVYEDLEGDLTWTSSPNTWTPASIDYNASNGDLIALYPLPSNFSLPKTEINLQLKADCSAPGATAGSNDIVMSVYFVADPSCNDVCKVSLACSETVSTTLICPTECEEGMAFQHFSIERTSFGMPDNNADGFADTSGSLDASKIKKNRVMTNDTIKAVFKGQIRTSEANPSWQYGYAKSTLPLGAYLDVVSASVKVYDQSTGSFITSDQVSVKKTAVGEVGVFDIDFSIHTLQAGGSSQFDGFLWGNEDSVEVTVYYTLSENIGGKIQEVTVNNEYYVSDIANPTSAANKYQCGFYDENITFIGYYFYVNKGTYSTISSCSDYITQFFYLSIGDCCSNYQGGNLFPYEYRNWAWIKDAKVTIPEGYEVLNIKLEQWITKATNTSIRQQIQSINPDSEINNELYFNLAQYYDINGGSLTLSDDGFRGRLSVEIAPTCDVTAGTYYDMPWSFNFQRANRLDGGQETGWMTSQPDKIKYAPASLRLTALNPKEDGLFKTVTWTVYVENTSSGSGANNAWVHIKSPTGTIKVVEVTDADSGTTLVLSGDIYQVGEIAKGQTRALNVTATYAACTLENITVYSGYECSAYPADFESFTCGYTQMNLSVEPKPAQFQVRIRDTFIGEGCSNDLEVEVEVRSVNLAVVDSLKINVIQPSDQSITYTDATSEFQYNLSQAFRDISDPSHVVNTYTYDVAAIDATIGENGLPGVLDLSNNTFKLKFHMQLENSFQAGDYLLVNVEGQAACGASLPDINLAVDPSMKFEKDTNSGLSTGVTNSWSASWGDYDNDGYEDLFVPEYDGSKVSHLYHNNGDGTFTEVTTAISNNKLDATSATWGDYDNDGDLDLFITGNAGSLSQLYNNQGDGTFSRVTNGEIVQGEGYDHSASWVDYDNDGFLDLYVLDIIQTKYNRLYHNNGDGTFTKVTGVEITNIISSSIGGTWSDYDNDGDMDIFIPNRDMENFLFKNEGNGQFTRVLDGDIVNENLGSVGSSWGDYDNDGDMDLFVANPGTKYNALYNNQGDGTFTKITTGPIVTDKGNTHGSAWTDLDNDGDLDLYVTNDAGEGNYLYMNNGDGTFQKLYNDLTEATQKSFGVATADFDNDGDQDIFVANHSGEPNQLYINSRGRCNQSICFTLIGTNSNRSAIGAKVRVRANIYGKDVWQMREITSQTGGGIGSQNSMKVLFGLGDASQIDELVVEWPSGIVQRLSGYSNGTCHEIVEEPGSSVCGKVYYDLNDNCVQDANEVGVPNQKIMITSADRNYELHTDKNGDYRIFLSNGSYQIDYVENANWSSCEDMYSLQILGEGQDTCDNNFGASSDCSLSDLTISAGNTVLHRGFENVYVISYKNLGVGVAENVSIQVNFPDAIEVKSSSISWSSKVNNVYTWDIGSMNPFEEGVIEVVSRTGLESNVGEFLTTNFTIATSSTECDATNNSYSDNTEVVGAIDPNDILVSDVKINRLDRPLTYVIRFQNIGSYHATFVKIQDHISNNLDLSTMKVVGSSHDITEIKTVGRNITWFFNNINLPDSTSDNAGSQGFVKYEIHPSQNLVHGDTIFNDASIVFDYEAPLITNTVHTVYHNPAKRIINVYPNPVSSHETVIHFEGDMTYPYDLTIYNSLGVKLVQMKGVDDYKVNLQSANLQPGSYVYQLHDQYGYLMTTGRLVVY
ncbi:FG-GAP-like repeat-containing protein [Fulvivirga ligni]|uniref:FG-GAP-like repeat-containing protein n=1 Tax=Fulvivirga ligni TaxID=2904246 RepID=UPI001F214391|nr:FG-GAP-like repeat-containing protein [Fulvivirga ligni]UII19758.1 FG-GAP-like repeat-containing protein [Fulvivirga ligni]